MAIPHNVQRELVSDMQASREVNRPVELKVEGSKRTGPTLNMHLKTLELPLRVFGNVLGIPKTKHFWVSLVDLLLDESCRLVHFIKLFTHFK